MDVLNGAGSLSWCKINTNVRAGDRAAKGRQTEETIKVAAGESSGDMHPVISVKQARQKQPQGSRAATGFMKTGRHHRVRAFKQRCEASCGQMLLEQ